MLIWTPPKTKSERMRLLRVLGHFYKKRVTPPADLTWWFAVQPVASVEHWQNEFYQALQVGGVEQPDLVLAGFDVLSTLHTSTRAGYKKLAKCTP